MSTRTPTTLEVQKALSLLKAQGRKIKYLEKLIADICFRFPGSLPELSPRIKSLLRPQQYSPEKVISDRLHGDELLGLVGVTISDLEEAFSRLVADEKDTFLSFRFTYRSDSGLFELVVEPLRLMPVIPTAS